MSSAIAVLRNSLAVGAITLAAAISVGIPLASGAPGCDGRCDVTSTTGGTDANGGSTNGGSTNKNGGSHGAQPTVPSAKLPPPAIISAQTVVQTAPPPPPVRLPPPVIEDRQPIIPNIPVNTQPEPPAVAPVVLMPAPAAVAPVPAVIPLPAPPSAPPAPLSTPVSRVLFTSSAQPGTQALTIIVLFMACGCWVYGNRIGSQITVRKKERAAAGA